jgi:hypothetical protein
MWHPVHIRAYRHNESTGTSTQTLVALRSIKGRGLWFGDHSFPWHPESGFISSRRKKMYRKNEIRPILIVVASLVHGSGAN